jgi:flagellar biosynthetic protein FliP
MRHLIFIILLVVLITISNSIQTSYAITIPNIEISFGKKDEPGKVAITLQIILLLTILSLAPAIIILMTSFTRIVVVLSFLRHAIGTNQMPPNQIIIGLSLFLTLFIMSPVWKEIHSKAIQPYISREITQKVAYERGIEPIRNFMFRQTREKDLAIFLNISNSNKVSERKDVPTLALIPAFVISELKTAFQIGFMIYIPFLILDMVVSSVLLSMGMFMLPPIMISLPFKLILFVLADGWNLLVGSLVRSFN